MRSKAIEHQSINHHRRPPASKSTAIGSLRKESCSFKTAIIQGSDISNILPNISGKDKSPDEVNAKNEVFLNLKVKLTCDTDGKWHASWAGLADTNAPSGPHLLGLSLDFKLSPTQDIRPGPKQHPNPGTQQGPRTQVWRPIGSKPNPMASQSNKIGRSGLSS